MAVCHPPFADSEGSDDTDDGFDEEADVGLEDITDTGDTIDHWEDDEQLKQSVKKSYRPSHRYIEHLTDDEYYHIMSKDARSYLKGREEEIIEIISVGKKVSSHFKTLSPDQVKEVYRIILDEVVADHWGLSDMTDKLMDKFPFLTYDEAFRIIKNETWRVLLYVKEQDALKQSDEYLYTWIGALDDHTTAPCYYLQTGEVREKDKALLAKNGYSESDLPYIPEEGLPIDELKEAVRQTAECYGFDMISDWVVHINCRHTFVRGKRNIPREIETELDEILANLPDEVPEETTEVVLDSTDTMIVPMDDPYPTYIFQNSIYRVPTVYQSENPEIFSFTGITEYDVASWARTIGQLRNDGMDDTTIAWAITDMGGIYDDDVGYILAHTDEIMSRATDNGW